MGKRATYTIESIDRFAALLKGMPVENKSRYSKKKVVNILYREISYLQRRGYTLAEISDVLTKGGFAISESTLRSYLCKIRSKKRKIEKQKNRQVNENVYDMQDVDEDVDDMQGIEIIDEEEEEELNVKRSYKK